MNSQRLIIGAIVGAIGVTAAERWMEPAASVPGAYDPVDASSTTISSSIDELPYDTEHRAFIVDRYGNPIERAVGDYRVDRQGDLFERHAPTTAVPRLADPSV